MYINLNLFPDIAITPCTYLYLEILVNFVLEENIQIHKKNPMPFRI